MFPTLFTIGQLQLQTNSLFTALAFLLGGFVFWRKSREEHYSESQAFDGYLLSIAFGFIIGRMAYVGLHWGQFGTDILKWFDVISYPGAQFTIGMVATGWYLARFAGQKKWDVCEVLDFWVIAMSITMAIQYIGSFFGGSMYGLPTQLPWGVVFPQTQEAVHPTQLYYAGFFFVLFWYLSKVEYQYRSFEWYRYGKKTAQTGFLLALYILLASAFSLVMSFISLPEFVIRGVALDGWMYGFSMLSAGILLWVRSGRHFLWFK